MDGECVVVSPSEPDATEPDVAEPSVAEPGVLEPDAEPSVEPDGTPEPLLDGGAPEPLLDGGDAAEPDSGTDGGPEAETDAGGGTPVGGDGGPSHPSVFDGALIKVALENTDINAGEALVLDVLRVEPGAACVLSVEGGEVEVDALGTETFFPDASGDVEIECVLADAVEAASLDYRVYTLLLEVFRDQSGGPRARVTTSHSQSCQASFADGTVVWQGSGNETEPLARTAGRLLVECDGANGSTIDDAVDFVVGVVGVNEPELVELGDGNVGIAWELTDGALCTLTLDNAIEILPETFYAGGTVVTPIDDGDGGIEGDWTFSCRNTLGESDSAFLIVDEPPSVADASGVRFHLIPVGTGAGGFGPGTGFFAVQMTWALTGACTLDGEPIANQGEEILEPEGPQATLVFYCEAGGQEDANVIRVETGQIFYPSTFDPHVVIGTAVHFDGGASSFGSLQVVSEALGVLGGGQVSAPNLETVGAGVYLGETTIESFVAPVLQSIQGDLQVGDLSAGSISFPSLTDIGAVRVEFADIATLDLGALSTVGGDFVVVDLETLDEINLPELDLMGGEFRVQRASNLLRLRAERLDVAGAVKVSGCGSLGLIDLNNVQTTGRMTVEDNASLQDLRLDDLTEVESSLSIRLNGTLEVLTGGSLEYASSVDITDNASLSNATAAAFVQGAETNTPPITCPNASPCGT